MDQQVEWKLPSLSILSQLLHGKKRQLKFNEITVEDGGNISDDDDVMLTVSDDVMTLWDKVRGLLDNILFLDQKMF